MRCLESQLMLGMGCFCFCNRGPMFSDLEELHVECVCVIRGVGRGFCFHVFYWY